jgi:hypothetical protein
VTAVGLAPRGTVLAEDVRELQNRPSHRPMALSRRRLPGVSRRLPVAGRD